MAAVTREKAYVIEKRGDQWCLLTKDGSKVLGCHDSEGQAQAQERAVEASKAARNHAQLHQIPGAEIFRTGTWNGDEYTTDDLDAIIEAANQVGYGVPLKAGHKDETGAPALGWVENLRRDGEILKADLVSLPDKVYEAIRDRAFDTVSAEIFWDLERNGQKFPRALKALALLGAEIPAVNLAPLRDLLKLNAVMLPPALQAASYTTELKLHEADASDKDEDVCDPDADGACPSGYEKGDDGKCHRSESKPYSKQTEPKPMTTKTAEPTKDVPLRDGEIIVSMSQVEELRRKAEKAERLEPLEAKLNAREKEYSELDAARREERIIFKMRDVKLPVFRPYIRALYDIATQSPEAKTYSIADRSALQAEKVVELLVQELNKQAEHLFTTLSTVTPGIPSGDPDEPEDTQGKIAYRVALYARANKMDPRKDYKTVLAAVLAADPALKIAYSQS